MRNLVKMGLRIAHQISAVAWFPPLLARVTLATSIGGSGIAKLHDFNGTLQYFHDLGLPQPYFQVYFVSVNEILWSALLILGLMTRLSVVPLAIIMLVAIVTARADQAHSFYSLTGVYEFIYIILFTYLGVGGAGALSLDAWLKKWANGPSTMLERTYR